MENIYIYINERQYILRMRSQFFLSVFQFFRDSFYYDTFFFFSFDTYTIHETKKIMTMDWALCHLPSTQTPKQSFYTLIDCCCCCSSSSSSSRPSSFSFFIYLRSRRFCITGLQHRDRCSRIHTSIQIAYQGLLHQIQIVLIAIYFSCQEIQLGSI